MWGQIEQDLAKQKIVKIATVELTAKVMQIYQKDIH